MKIRNTILALPLCLGLSGCFTFGETTMTIEQAVAAAQNAVVTACGFQPTASTILDIVNTFTGLNPTITLVNQIASDVCAQVLATRSLRGVQRRGVSLGRYRGVPIRGRFVR